MIERSQDAEPPSLPENPIEVHDDTFLVGAAPMSTRVTFLLPKRAPDPKAH